MKKIILATVAFSMTATPAAFAQSYKHYGPPQKHYSQKQYSNSHKQSTKQVQKKRWSKGQRLDQHHRRNVVHQRDYRRYRLNQPPRGYHWVRVDNDFILVAAATGIISTIIGAAIANSR